MFNRKFDFSKEACIIESMVNNLLCNSLEKNSAARNCDFDGIVNVSFFAVACANFPRPYNSPIIQNGIRQSIIADL
jgi:hypothetical protein